MIQLRTCCSSRAGFVRVPAVGRAERPRDTRREEGRERTCRRASAQAQQRETGMREGKHELSCRKLFF